MCEVKIALIAWVCGAAGCFLGVMIMALVQIGRDRKKPVFPEITEEYMDLAADAFAKHQNKMWSKAIEGIKNET